MSKQKQLIRERFNFACLNRDGHKCVFCERTDNLDVHHIRNRSLMPNGGYVRQNGITLCPEHHLMAEKFHQTNGAEWVEGMHPDDLYRMIGSSREEAVRASERLRG